MDKPQNPGMIPVETIPQGGFFTKRTGSTAYLRVSDNASKFLKLDVEVFVYGVSYSGSVTRVKRGTWVRPTTQKAMDANRADEEQWSATFARPFNPDDRCTDEQGRY
jgi:hypothetical protein